MAKRLEENPGVVAWACKPLGKVLLLLSFGWIFRDLSLAGELLGRNDWSQIMVAVTLCSWAGPYRLQVLALSTLVLLVLAPDWYPSVWLTKMQVREGVEGDALRLLRPLALLIIGYWAAVALYLRRRYPDSLAGRWPVLSLIVLYITLLALGSGPWLVGWARLLFFSGVWALSAYLWYIAFALRDITSPQRPPIWHELASFHPFFGGTWIPIGLGAAHLRQRQVKCAQSLAVCQIKGLKLVVCCWLLFRLDQGLIKLRAVMGVPGFSDLLHEHLTGRVIYPRSMCWVSMLYSFFEGVVAAFALGNLLVACARMGGFRLLQQVYRPLSARSVSDYWNRISYYYKQAIVELFFYPCFLRYGKGYPRLRLGLAIFVAAGLGNMLYHLRSVLPWMARLGLAETLWGMRTYACYCVILSLGLWLSMLRAPARPIQPDLVQRILILTRVILFFSVLSVFDELYTPDSPWVRLRFLGYLCGLV